MGRDVGANFGHLFGEVAEERGGAVGGGGVVQTDKVGVGAGVGGVGEGGDGAETVGFVTGECEWWCGIEGEEDVLVTEAMPYHQR